MQSMISKIKETHNWLMNFLFIEQKTGELSHTKFWSNLGYATMIETFFYSVHYGSKASETLWFVFGVVVIGNRTLLRLLGKNGSASKSAE